MSAPEPATEYEGAVESYRPAAADPELLALRLAQIEMRLRRLEGLVRVEDVDAQIQAANTKGARNG